MAVVTTGSEDHDLLFVGTSGRARLVIDEIEELVDDAVVVCIMRISPAAVVLWQSERLGHLPEQGGSFPTTLVNLRTGRRHAPQRQRPSARQQLCGTRIRSPGACA